MKQYYLVIKTENFTVLGVVQNVTIDLDKATENVSMSSSLARNLRCFLDGRSVNLNLCGNLFFSGPYGICVTDAQYEEQAIRYIAEYLKDKKDGSLNFIKDLYHKHPLDHSGCNESGYHHFEVEPNMVLNIKSHWNNFKDYKNDLKSKYRVKVNRAETLSADLICKEFDAEKILSHKDELQQLLENITDKALWKTVDLNIKVYAELKKAYSDAVIFNVYYLKETIVGFASAFQNANSLIAHFVGIDYQLNKDHSIYPRILNDYVKLSIDRKCNTLDLGRTSSEIKSTLGAVPVDLHCFVRHKRSLANLIFKPLTKKIDLPEFKQHKPFKN